MFIAQPEHKGGFQVSWSYISKFSTMVENPNLPRWVTWAAPSKGNPGIGPDTRIWPIIPSGDNSMLWHPTPPRVPELALWQF